MKIQGVNDDELENLTDAEREALEEGDKDEAVTAAALKEVAAGEDEPKHKPGEEDEDEDDNAKAEREKAEAAAAEKAENARVEAEAKEKREAELKAMSKEDRAAAEAADKEAAEKAAAEAAAKEKAEVEAKAKAEAEAKAKAEGAGAEDEDAPGRARIPRYEVKPVEKYDEKMKALDTKEAEAQAKFDAADIDLKELLSINRKISADRAELRDANLRATMAAEYNEKAAQAEWMGDVQDFFATVKQKSGIDYDKPLLNAAFDRAIKTLAADDANSKRSNQWFLREADKQVKAEIGFVAKEPSAAEKEAARLAAEKGKEKPQGRKPALAVVKDVGGMPSAGDDDAAGGNPEFAALDKLDGIEYEDALARMPQAKQDAYLRQRAA